jgi:flagellar basal body-associated protein FliL
MAIKFACKNCGKRFSAQEEHAGRKSKCPVCGHGIEVPWPATPISGAPPPLVPPVIPLQATDPAPGRPLRKIPVIVIVAAVLALILAVPFAYLAWPHSRSDRSETSTKETSAKKTLRLSGPPAPVPIETMFEQLIRTYMESAYNERYNYVYDGIKLKGQMAKHYSESPPIRSKIDTIRIDKIDQLRADASVVTATAIDRASGVENSRDFYVRKAGSKWLIDWPGTVGLNPISIRAFIATAPRQDTTLRVTAKLGDSYNYQYLYEKPRRYSIMLADQRGDFIHGYVERRSALGDELYRILDDGAEHQIGVTVQCTGTEGCVAEIVGLASKTWLID